MESIRIQAKFIVISPEQILHRGQLVVRQGRVVEFCESAGKRADIDLADSVLLPGFVNPHTHLEFCDLAQPFPAGTNFPDWIRSVVEHRSANPCSAEQRLATIGTGAAECFQTGSAFIADIVTQPWRWDETTVRSAFDKSRRDNLRSVHGVVGRSSIAQAAWDEHLGVLAQPRLQPFPELLGLSAERFADSVAWANSILNQELTGQGSMIRQVGISPHSPYSTSYPAVVEACEGMARSVPFAMHVAESLEERQWADEGSGPFRTAFKRLGMTLPLARLQIREAIELLAKRDRSLLIHGNYLTADEMDAVAAAGTISVVYCPRTHAHFGHSPYPLEALRRRGIRVVFGTDSRASSPDLNIWSDVQAARRQHPHLDPRDAFAAITSEAAAALGCEQDFGSLKGGKLAYINVIPAKSDYTLPTLLEQLTMDSPELCPLAWLWASSAE